MKRFLKVIAGALVGALVVQGYFAAWLQQTTTSPLGNSIFFTAFLLLATGIAWAFTYIND